jgi:outer membrane protein OmpA-like peptidoglycan-associated protein
LTINFPVNGDILDNDARALIDREFVPIAKQFNNARVRIEGNTGNRAYNESLSSRRAQAVANYLINDYGSLLLVMVPRMQSVTVCRVPTSTIGQLTLCS